MACDLTISELVPTAATVRGGDGYATLTYASSAASNVHWAVVGPNNRDANYTPGNTSAIFYLPAGAYTYTLSLVDEPGCQLTGSFTIEEPAPPVPVDPSLGDAPRWEPVGGVLPNPVLLAVTASLTDSSGNARAGLHVEVALWRPGAVAAFATFRATVRTATQYVDAAPYLRGELVAAQRYAATASSPLLDADTCLRFYYRFRVVDSASVEAWQERAGARYAVLAALPAATDTMAPYVADGTGRVASIFPDGEGAQFVGFPLEASVLLPSAQATRYAELRYLDALGQELEIRSFALVSTLPAGMLRIPLPPNPLPCAASVEVAIVDADRAYAGHCGGVPTPSPTPGYLLTETGFLKL